MTVSSRIAAVLFLASLVSALGCGGGGSSATPTPEQAATTPPLATPTQQNAQGFTAPEVPPQ